MIVGLFPVEVVVRIAFVTRFKNYPKGDFPGGDETVHKQIESMLLERGHRVDFFGVDSAKEVFPKNIILKLLGNQFLLIDPYYTAKYFNTIGHQYDVVICSGEHGAYIRHPHALVLYHFSSLGFSRHYFFKNIVWKDLLNPGMLTMILYLTRRRLLENRASIGKRVVTVSNFVGDFLAEQGIRVDEIIQNCVDTERFKPLFPGSKNDLLFVGRYDYFSKGFDVLEKLAKKGLFIDCYTNKEFHPELHIQGLAPREKMPEIYRQYKILIFPSRYESCPMVPIEAMASGLPIVMSNVGIGPDLKKEIPEFVVDGFDDEAVEQYEKRAKYILANIEVFSQKARDYAVKHHSIAKFNAEWLTLIEGVAH